MSWKDELKPASFKGVPFRVDTASMEFGWTATEKSTATSNLKWKEGKEPPEVTGTPDDDPLIDQGSKGAKTFSVQAHFTGDDYISTRNAFIAAIEEGGEGILQLPLMEPMTVVAGRATTEFSNSGGGYESVSVSFIETTIKPKPEVSTNEKKEAEVLAEEGKQSLLESFTEKFNSAVSGSSDLADDLSGHFLDVLGFGEAGDTFSDFVSKATELSEDARTIIQTPQRFVEQILDIADDLTFAFTDPIDALNAQLHIFETYRETLIFSENGSESRRLQVQNNTAVAMAVENACLQQALIAATLTEFETLDDAVSVRRELEDAVRAQQVRNGDTVGYDGIYNTLSVLLGSVTRYINDTAGLPSTLDVEFGDNIPALVIAEDYYGDAERADELATRNAVRNPLFMPKTVEVLSK